MKISFLLKSAVMFSAIIAFSFAWKVNTARAYCEIALRNIQIEKALAPNQINSIGVFPFDDLMIRV
jgi:hypothetical protein